MFGTLFRNWLTSLATFPSALATAANSAFFMVSLKLLSSSDFLVEKSSVLTIDLAIIPERTSKRTASTEQYDLFSSELMNLYF